MKKGEGLHSCACQHSLYNSKSNMVGRGMELLWSSEIQFPCPGMLNKFQILSVGTLCRVSEAEWGSVGVLPALLPTAHEHFHTH